MDAVKNAERSSFRTGVKNMMRRLEFTGDFGIATTVYEEQLETKFSTETENVCTLSLYYDVDGIGATPPTFL